MHRVSSPAFVSRATARAPISDRSRMANGYEVSYPLHSWWNAQRACDLQAALETVFPHESQQVIEDLFCFQRDFQDVPAGVGQGPLLRFLGALQFQGKEGNRHVCLAADADEQTKHSYEEMVFYIQDILKSSELKQVMENSKPINRVKLFRNITMVSLVVICSVIAAGLLGGFFAIPLGVYSVPAVFALGLAGVQFCYHTKQRSGLALAQDTLGGLLGGMGDDLLDLMRRYERYPPAQTDYQPQLWHDLEKLRAGTPIVAASLDKCVFQFKQYALWQLLLNGSLQCRLLQAIQTKDEGTCTTLLEPLLRGVRYISNSEPDPPVKAIWQHLVPVWFAAVRQGDPTICAVFLAAGMRWVDVPDSEGCAAIHRAAELGHEALCRLLLDKGAFENRGDKTTDYDRIWNKGGGGRRPLDYAVSAGHGPVCRLFMEKDARGEHGETALELAVVAKNWDLCRLLLGADGVNTTHNMGSRFNGKELPWFNREELPLEYAVSSQNEAFCKFCLEAGADVHVGSGGDKSPLKRALESQNIAICRILLAAAPLDERYYKMLFSSALDADERALFPVFLEAHPGVDLNFRDSADYTLLDRAVGVALRQKKLLFSFLNEGEQLALRYKTIVAQDESLCQLLIGAGADINALDGQNLMTLLHYAVLAKDESRCQFLIGLGADIQAVDGKHLMTPLHHAVLSRDESICRLLIGLGADIQAPEGKLLLTPLTAAVMIKECDSVCRALLECPADRGLTTSMDYLWTPLFWAIRKKKASICKILLAHAADKQRELDGRPLWQLGLETGDTEIFTAFLEAGVDINVQDTNGETALHHVMRDQENEAFCLILLTHKANVRVANHSVQTPLHLVRHSGNASLLLQAGADVNAKDNVGRTPLSCAVQSKNAALCVILLAAGASVSCDVEGRPVWQTAMESADTEFVQTFLHGLHNSEDMPIKLALAAYCKCKELFESLLRAGADMGAIHDYLLLPKKDTGPSTKAAQDQLQSFLKDLDPNMFKALRMEISDCLLDNTPLIRDLANIVLDYRDKFDFR